jgi:cellulose synthase/poly-beta-1,6-N-acetylglucosamine synthase-like glycosyltransferase
MVTWGYLALAVLPWAIFWAALLITRSRLRRMFAASPPLPPLPPHVTIVTPAKDEAAHIETCVRGLLAQDYPNFSVRVIDDRSSDGTGAILDRMVGEESGAKASGLSVRHIIALPDEWLGKCHALFEGTRDLTSDWLLFVDSDVSIEPAALSRTLALALSRGYDAVSLLPRLDARSFIERLMIPVCGSAWGIMFVMHWTNDDHRAGFAVANGQFFLIRREAYEKVDGHRGVRMQIVEDVELMRSLKAAGYKCRLFAGPHLVATRMHATLDELRSGWGRIFAGTARYRRWPMIGAIAFLIVCGLSVYFLLGIGVYLWFTKSDPRLLVAAAVHWALLTTFLMYAYQAVRVSVVYGLLPFISFPLLIGLLWRGVQRCGDKKFDWRGTAVEIGSN